MLEQGIILLIIIGLLVAFACAFDTTVDNGPEICKKCKHGYDIGDQAIFWVCKEKHEPKDEYTCDYFEPKPFPWDVMIGMLIVVVLLLCLGFWWMSTLP